MNFGDKNVGVYDIIIANEDRGKLLGFGVLM